jgi:HEAT repeat protein
VAVVAILLGASGLVEDLEALRSGDAAERRAARDALVAAGTDVVPLLRGLFEGGFPGLDERIASLLEALRSDDWKRREEAQEALIAIGPRVRSSVEPLRRDPDPEVAARAAFILSAVAAREQEDARAYERQIAGACDVAGAIGDPSLLDALASLLGDGRAQVRAAALGAIVAIGTPRAPEIVAERYAQAEDWRERLALLRGWGAAIPPALLERARSDPSPWVRAWAVARSGCASEADLSVLETMLRSADWADRAAAARAAAQFGVELDVSAPASDEAIGRLRAAIRGSAPER